MTVTKRVRYEVLRRDDYTCRYCGRRAPDATIQVDHVIPVSLGGGDEPTNLVTACSDCNSGKSSVQPDAALVDDVAADALRWRAAMDRAFDTWRHDRGVLTDDVAMFEVEWASWADASGPVPMDPNWAASVERWMSVGFSITDLTSLVSVAMRRESVKRNERWRYYCGVIWGTLRDLQEKVQEDCAQSVDNLGISEELSTGYEQEAEMSTFDPQEIHSPIPMGPVPLTSEDEGYPQYPQALLPPPGSSERHLGVALSPKEHIARCRQAIEEARQQAATEMWTQAWEASGKKLRGSRGA